MRRVALLTMLAFGCATVRQPVAPSVLPPMSAEPPPLAAPPRVESELELWMEGTGPIDPAEAAQARDASLEALSQAIAVQGLEAAAGDDLVLVRARGVVRTEGRKSAQLWSVIGIVVTVVVVVVTALLATKSRSSPRGTAPPRAAVPAPPRSSSHPSGAAVPVPHGPYAPQFLGPPPRAPPFSLDVDLWMEVPLYETPPPPIAPPWTTPSDEWIAARGWFDGEELELMVTLVDRGTRAVRWSNTVRKRVDPRDTEGVSKLLGKALTDGPLSQKTP